MALEFIKTLHHLLKGSSRILLLYIQKGGSDMGFNSGFHEKMDALDLIINALLDHEKRLDAISHRLEKLVSSTSLKESARVAKETHKFEPRIVEKPPRVIFNNWSEYTTTCRGTTMVAFEVEGNRFHVYTLVDDRVFTYVETLPETRMKVSEDPTHISIDKTSLNTVDRFQFLIDGRLKCGLTLSIESSRTLLKENEHIFELCYDFKSDAVKEFLSKELGVAKDKIVAGKITF